MSKGRSSSEPLGLLLTFLGLTFLGPLVGSVIFVVLPKPPQMWMGVLENAPLFVIVGYMIGFLPALATAILIVIVDRRAGAEVSRPRVALLIGAAFSFMVGAFIFRGSQMSAFIPGALALEAVFQIETPVSGGLAAFLIVYFRRTPPLDWPRWLRTILGVRAAPPDDDGETLR